MLPLLCQMTLMEHICRCLLWSTAAPPCESLQQQLMQIHSCVPVTPGFYILAGAPCSHQEQMGERSSLYVTSAQQSKTTRAEKVQLHWLNLEHIVSNHANVKS